MTIHIGIVMDDINNIKTVKDSSFAMMLAAQKRGWVIHYMQQHDLYTTNKTAYANAQQIRVTDDKNNYFEIVAESIIELKDLDVIIMRKDPPFDIEYITTTYILDMAQQAGSLVVNRPSSLRDHNEKMFITQFPQCCTPILISRDSSKLRDFIDEQNDVILKPLDGMGGISIYRVNPHDHNLSVILETITNYGKKTIMAQTYIPEISQGDKRILLIDGNPVPYSLARIPAKGETRGNLAAGAKASGLELSDNDRWICEQIAPTLKENGILFAGIDVIGNYLTEINITSPTCIRELDTIYNLDIAGDLLDCIENRLRADISAS